MTAKQKKDPFSVLAKGRAKGRELVLNRDRVDHVCYQSGRSSLISHAAGDKL